MDIQSFISEHFYDVLFCSLTIIGGVIATIILNKRSNKTNSYQLRAYIPTIWTSLGILFTFVSIYVSLLKYNGDDIMLLINNIVPAFSTSIIGIAGAIWTSISNKWKLAEDEKKDNDKFNRLNRALSRNGEINSPELVLFEIVESIRNGNKAIVDKLNVSEQNETQQFTQLNGLLSRLSGEANATISGALKTQKEDFGSAIGNLQSSFNVALDKQNNTLAEKMASLESMLKVEIGNMQTANNGFINTLVTTVNSLMDTIKDKLAKESEERNKQLIDYINGEGTRNRDFIKKQEELYESIKVSIETLLTDMRRLFEEDVKRTINTFAEKQHELSANTIELCNTKLISDSNDYLSNHMSAMSVYLASLDRQTQETYNSFIETVKTMEENVASKMGELYEKQNGLIKQTIDDNRNSINSSLKENESSIQRILDANKDAIETVSIEIKNDNEEIKKELVASQKRWKDEAEEVQRTHNSEVKIINDNARVSIQDILTKITSIEMALQLSLTKIKDDVVKSIESFEKEQNEVRKFVIESNKGLQTDLTKQIHDAFQINEAKDASSKLIDSIHNTINSLNTQTTSIAGNLSKVNESIVNSTENYSKVVGESNDVIRYISGTLELFKNHINTIHILNSNVNSLESVLSELQQSIQQMKELQDNSNVGKISGKRNKTEQK